ncbi:hypothetical protein Q8A73_012907 [Channa argus]|nr:hypothetical protein Q8A73_012907 [Channa argus]
MGFGHTSAGLLLLVVTIGLAPMPVGAESPTTGNITTTARNTRTTPAVSVVVDVTAVFLEPYGPQLTNGQSIQFKMLEGHVVEMFYAIYQTHYGALLEQVFVRQFSEVVVNAQESYTEAVVGVQFSSTAPAVDIPQAYDVAKTLLDAVSNSNNTFNVTVVPSSIKAAPETTTAPTTAESTITPAPNSTLTSTAAGSTSTASATATTPTTPAAPTTLTPTTLESTTREYLNNNSNSNHSRINHHSYSNNKTDYNHCSAINNFLNKCLDTCSFNNCSANSNNYYPYNNISNINNSCFHNFNKSSNNNYNTNYSINCCCHDNWYGHENLITKTPVPTTGGSSIVLHPTNISTTTTITAPATPVVVAVTAVLDESFVPQLTDRNSPQFKTLEVQVIQMWYVIYKRQYGDLLDQVFVIEFREAVVKTRASNIEAVVGVQFSITAPPADIPQADNVAKTLVDAVSNPNNTFILTIMPIYQNAFSSFHSLQVTRYSNGSIYNHLKLGFASKSVPNNSQIGQVLLKNVANITAFIIDLNSVFVNDIQVSSGASPKISLITASCLVRLSWLVTKQQ